MVMDLLSLTQIQTLTTQFIGNMNNTNFRYWLQGLFELTPATNWHGHVFSKEQTKIVRDHLLLVKATEPLDGFTAWLEGFLDGEGTNLGLIQSKLEESFKQVRLSTGLVISQGGGYRLTGPLDTTVC
jgi:hypothetical protein